MDSNILSLKVKASLNYTIEVHEVQEEADRLFGPGTEVDDDLMIKIAKRLVFKKLEHGLDVRSFESEDFDYEVKNEYKIQVRDGNSR